MNYFSKLCVAGALLLAAATSFASFHTFKIDQIYSNADGTVQFVVMREAAGANGENFWAGHALTSTRAGVSKVYVFPNNLPGGDDDDCMGYYCNPSLSPTANKRVLIGTQGFAALGIVTPDYVIQDGFLPTDGGTLNFAGVDQVPFGPLPTDGTNAINRFGVNVQNVATNFAGNSASVSPQSPVALVPYAGVWWNPNESGSGYNIDVRNGTLVLTVFSYEAGTGHSEWYLSSGPLTQNGAKYVGTLDKYRGGQCISCAYVAPTPTANDGTITITFASATSATLTLPGNRTTNIVPLLGNPPAPVALFPYVGVWWNPNESGSGYNIDVRNGTLVLTVFSYVAGTGHSEWYLSSGPLTENGTKYVGTLDKYRGGQCISCAYVLPTPTGNDGTITITFTAATSATLSLPGNRTTNIVPLLGF